jgi:hypothetical protein
MTGAAKPGKVGLERANLRSHDELAMAEHAINRVVDLATEPTPLRGHVDERDRRGIETGVLVHWACLRYRIFGRKTGRHFS